MLRIAMPRKRLLTNISLHSMASLPLPHSVVGIVLLFGKNFEKQFPTSRANHKLKIGFSLLPKHSSAAPRLALVKMGSRAEETLGTGFLQFNAHKWPFIGTQN